MHAITQTRGYDYLVSRPANAVEHPGRRWPLILFLHGAGERGANIQDVTRQGLPRLLAGGPDLSAPERAIAHDVAQSFIVIAPQCPHHEVWDDAALLALLEELGHDPAIDPARVYLAGMSMGGFGAWSLSLRHPQRFAALVAVCGGGRIADVHAAARAQPNALQQLAVWAFHGAKDPIVPLEESTRMIEALQAAHVREVKLTVYPEIAHEAWTPAFGNPDLYTWLLRQSRNER